jgi:2-polyprenyl-6-methoxyphenol hydroxylase-like FAD-dependent oxidoreductase
MNGVTDYVVFERDASATPGPWQQGGTLDLHESSGQLALRRAGLFDEFSRHLARWDASRVHILDPAGKTVIRTDGDSKRPEIDRLQLRQLLLDSVPTHKIRWNHAVNAVERRGDGDDSDGLTGNGCVIQFTDGTSMSGFRLIVGADGAWSKVRPLVS